MGIPGFFKRWLSQKVPYVIEKKIPFNVTSLSFDLNGLFHSVATKVFNYKTDDPKLLEILSKVEPQQLEIELITQIGTSILDIIKQVRPRDFVMLSVDGMVPVSKIQQQKRRREKTARNRDVLEKFDRNSITPGTRFMFELSNYLTRFVMQNQKEFPPHVVYSSHLVTGEGEQKIMEYYRTNTYKQGNHIVYGLDADLIMLCLLSPVTNIYVARENLNQLINIHELRKYLKRRTKKPTAVEDFVVMMYFIGNDFLPHIPCFDDIFTSVELLLDVYSQGDYRLTLDNNEINWSDMRRFVSKLTEVENKLLIDLYSKERGHLSTILQKAVIEQKFYPSVFRREWYKNSFGPRDETMPLASVIQKIINLDLPPELEPVYNILEPNEKKITEMSINYLQMMSWTYLYYRQGGDYVNIGLYYAYHHAPLLQDLLRVLDKIGKEYEILGYKAFNGMIRYTVLHQMVAVIPIKSKDLLPLELQNLYLYNSPIRDFYLENFIIEKGNEDREDLVIIPFIDMQRIIEAVIQHPMKKDYVMKWLPEQTKILKQRK